jgi:hypothetical protein
MQKKNSLSQAAPILIAGFFLVMPIVVLLKIAWAKSAPTADELTQEYIRAVHLAMQPGPEYVSHSLISIDPDKPVRVVAFIRRNQIPDYEGKKVAPANKQTWVTVVPRLKTFCQDYVKSRGADPERLKLRLKQRLGLPPQPAYDSFVVLMVDPKDISNLFRPCGDPSTTTTTCAPASPPKPEEMKDKLKALNSGNSNEVQDYWFLSNYYWSYAPPYQYPWTTLGYTFDWAPREDGSEDFVRWGESEFVIPAGAPIQFVSASDAVAYCTPQ